MAIEASKPSLVAVILAGGSGTRFWPRSRKARSKQVLSLEGDRTMIQNTVARLSDLTSPNDVWVITNDQLAPTIAEQLPEIPHERMLCEPASRNTAPACALAAFLLERKTPDAVIAIFPSDHTIGDLARFREVLRAGARLASSGEKIVVLGVPPTRTETGVRIHRAWVGRVAGRWRQARDSCAASSAFHGEARPGARAHVCTFR